MAKRTYQTPRGTKDVLPDEQKHWDFVVDVVKEEAFNAGFRRIDTPIFEDSGLFVKSVGKNTDIVEKEMYTFKDKSGNSLTLRPEGTAPIIRAYLEGGMQSLPHPVNLFYIGSMFRYERPQAGRYRQFHQYGFETIGESNPVIDAQLIALSLRILRKLGLENLLLEINSLGCPSCRPKYRKLLVDYLSDYKKKLCTDCKQRLKTNPLRIFDCKQKSCQEIIASAPQLINYLCQSCHEHFRHVLEYLDDLELSYELNPRLARGLDYYTKTVWEIWPAKPLEGEELGSQAALGGGGRYDKLIELLGGRPTPALGFACGIERPIAMIKEEKIEIPEKRKTQVFIAQLGEKAQKICFKLLNELQDAGIAVVGSLEKKSIGSQFKEANRLKVPLTILVGQKEAFDGTVILKDMVSGSQEIIPQEKIVKVLLKRLES